MFGVLMFSICTMIALSKNGESSGKSSDGGGFLGGILAALTTAVAIKAALGQLGWIKDKDKEKEGEEGEEGKEDKKGKDDATLNKNKALFLFQKEVESKKDDTSEEANTLRESYNSYIKCAYNEDGSEKSPEEFEKGMNALPQKFKDNITKQTKAASDDKKVVEEFENNAKKVTDAQAASAVSKAKGDRATIAKNDELKKLEEEFNKAKENKSEEEIKELEKEYNSKKEAATKKWDAEIEKHNTQAKKLSDETSVQNDDKIKDAEAKKKELEKEREELNKSDADKEMVQKYLDFEFKDGLEPGKLDSASEEDKKKAKEQLEKAGLNPDLYNKINAASVSSKDQENKAETILKDDDIKKSVDKSISDKKADLDTKIKEQDDAISKLNNDNNVIDKNNGEEDKEGEEGKEKEEGKEGEEGKEKEEKEEGKEKEEGDDDDAEEETKDDTGVVWIKRKKERGEGFTYCRKDDRSVTISKDEYNAKKKAKKEHFYMSIKDYLTEAFLRK